MSSRPYALAMSARLAAGFMCAGLMTATTSVALAQPSPGAAGPAAASLAGCPPRKPVLRVAGVFTEEFSSHPVETRFASTHYARLYLTPLFGSDPWEEKVDARYGVAESWTYLPGARGIEIKLRKGLTFNNGEPITAKDVVFSIRMFMSKFAEDQLSAALRGMDLKMEIIDDHNLRIDFAKGNVTFAQEFSTLVFPLYVTSEAYHSGGDISQESIDRFRANPLAGGPYRVASRQAQQSIILEAARRDPLLGCPTYDRVEIRNLPETGTRMAQFRTGALDIIAGNRDLIQQAKSIGAQVVEKPANNMIGLYLFQTYVESNIFRDVRVRQAAAHAIDHQLIADTIWKGIGVEPWGCTWPPSTEISRQNPAYAKACATPYAYNPARAKQLLSEAGFGASHPAIKLVYWGNYPEEAALAEAMQPMLNAVGFNATVEKIDRGEYARRINNQGYSNSIMFFGPGGRVTSLSGSYFAYAGGMGPTQDKDVQNALARATGAATLDEYMAATAEIARLGHERAYSPGFFASGSIFFVRKDIPDWGLKRSVGRGPLNLVPLVTDLKP
jgi:peptide/nickel transport system substrate-binding protein